MRVTLDGDRIVIDLGDMRDPKAAAIKWRIASRLLAAHRAELETGAGQ